MVNSPMKSSVPLWRSIVIWDRGWMRKYTKTRCASNFQKDPSTSHSKIFPVHYHNRYVGKLITDLIADSNVIVETKVVDQIIDAHIAEVLSYLSITGLKVGLILNFKPASLVVKRVANIYLKNQ